ncbi:ATP-binding protein [Thiolapillus sp.]
MRSIHLRLLLVATLVLAGFLGVAGWALDSAFRKSSETALREKLQSRVYGLLAAADVDLRGRMQLPKDLPEPRFSRPDSGLYAFVSTSDGKLFWRSRSSLGLRMPDAPLLPAGESRFHRLDGHFLFSYGVEWEDDAGESRTYTFNVVEQVQPFDSQLAAFRLNLWAWLGGLALALLLVQALVLRWGLRPLRQVETDLQVIHQGQAKRLAGDYPTELQGLTSSLNALMEHADSVQQRYRNSLDDLVHSLKTPLAYLGAVLQDNKVSCSQLRKTTVEQLDRMDHIVQHQLSRAAVAARSALTEPVAVAPIVVRLLDTLEKIYAEKKLSCVRELENRAVFYGDEADLMEVLGNLLENAFKYANSKVHVSMEDNGRLTLLIEDDGPGIPGARWHELLQRGKRADETVAGQGIGLAVANEIITLYGGALEAGRSPLGGLALRIRFAARDPALPAKHDGDSKTTHSL